MTPDSPTPADAADLLELCRRVDVGWWGRAETDAEEVEDTLRYGGEHGEQPFLIRGAGRLVGAALNLPGRESWLLVDPSSPRAEQTTLYESLLGFLVAREAEDVVAPAGDADRLAACVRFGYRRAHSSYELEHDGTRPVPAVRWPVGVRLRPMELDRDAPAMYELIYSVWTDVPGHRHRSYGEWRRLLVDGRPITPTLQVLAERDDALVGVALAHVYAGTDGWVAQLAVDRDARGLGLGKGLLLEVTRRLRSVEPALEVVGLSAVAENDAALSLYLAADYRVTRELVHCRRGAGH